MGSLRSSSHAHDLGHLANEALAEYLTGALADAAGNEADIATTKGRG